jgi:hypothetical protein
MKKMTEMTFDEARAYTKAHRKELNAKYAAARISGLDEFK